MNVFIGTSGWHYKHWLDGVFYPVETASSEMFDFYARHFNTVEINNSFYRLPTAKTVVAWRESAPHDFVFAMKASRFITHMKKLKDAKTSFKKFFLMADRLEKKLGPILFQLPPRWKLNTDRLAEFLEALPERHRYAFEFRDQSWVVPEVFQLLRKYQAAFCIHDFADMKMPLEITSDFTYVRLHGPTSTKYAGSYSTRQLRSWAERIDGWRSELSATYVFFNNDPEGAAVKNAQTLKRQLEPAP